MMLSLLLRLALRNLFRNRRRTIIALVSISLSVALTSLMRFLTFGVHQENIEQVVELSTGYMQVAAYGWLESRRQLDRAVDYTEELQQKLKHPAIKHVSPRIESGALIAFRENSAFVQVHGASPDQEKKVTNVHEYVVEGQYLEGGLKQEPRERNQAVDQTPVYDIMIGHRLASNLEVSLGDEVSIVGTRFDGSTGAILGQVQGIIKTGNPGLDGSKVWTDLTAARQLFAPDDPERDLRRYTSIVLGSSSALEAKDQYQDLKELFPRPETELEPEFARNYEPVLHLWDELNQDLVQYLLLDRIGNEVTMSFLILIMAAGVMTTVEMALHERRREFGILMAIGTRGSHLV